MLGQDGQILDINETVAHRRRGNITKRLVCVPIVHHDAHVGCIDNPVIIEIDNRCNLYLPYIPIMSKHIRAASKIDC